MQVETFFAEKGLYIIGYYHANERLGDNELGSVARKISDRIYANCSNSFSLLVPILNALMYIVISMTRLIVSTGFFRYS